MKILYLLSLYIIFFINANAQTFDWFWTKTPQASSNVGSGSTNITTDNLSNVYMAGGFHSGSITFDTYILTCLGSAAHGEAFLAKYSPNGNVIWAKSNSGTTNSSNGGLVTADVFGNIYLAGGLTDTIAWDTDTLICGHYGFDAFLGKFDSSGNVLWLRKAVSSDRSSIGSVATDASGNIYVTGYDQATNFTIGSFTFTNPTGEYVFIAKYDSSGTVLWAKVTGSATMNQSTSIAADGLGNVYLAGGFSAPYLVFGSDTVFRVASGTNDFLVKFDSSGNALWTKNIGINGSPLLATDAINNVYVANGPDDFSFLRKYNSAGNLIWERVDSADYLQGIGLATDKHNAIYYAGQFPNRDSVSIDAVTITKIPGSNATYIMEFDSSGTAIWGKTIQGGVEDPLSVAVASSGCVYAAGGFLASPFILDNDTLIPSSPNENVFVGKLCYTGIAENISETKKDNEVVIFPNPFTNHFSVTINTNEPSEIILYDITSRELLHRSFVNSASINTEQLARGIYLYEVWRKNEVVGRGKLVKE